MKETTRYWVYLSDYDMETAEAMLLTRRFLYVGFMCHQSIEKILKAYWTTISNEPPIFTHSLSKLAERTGLSEEFSKGHYKIVDILEPLNIEARYPSYKERLMKSLTKERCIQIISQTNELRLWIKKKL